MAPEIGVSVVRDLVYRDNAGWSLYMAVYFPNIDKLAPAVLLRGGGWMSHAQGADGDLLWLMEASWQWRIGCRQGRISQRACLIYTRLLAHADNCGVDVPRIAILGCSLRAQMTTVLG